MNCQPSVKMHIPIQASVLNNIYWDPLRGLRKNEIQIVQWYQAISVGEGLKRDKGLTRSASWEASFLAAAIPPLSFTICMAFSSEPSSENSSSMRSLNWSPWELCNAKIAGAVKFPVERSWPCKGVSNVNIEIWGCLSDEPLYILRKAPHGDRRHIDWCACDWITPGFHYWQPREAYRKQGHNIARQHASLCRSLKQENMHIL